MNTAQPAPASENLHWQKEWDERMGQVHNPVRYNKTAVLLLYWDKQEDDLHTEKEVKALRDVFENDYRFLVHEGVLSTRGGRAALLARAALSTFVANESDPNTLLIVYYAGHGYSKVQDESGNIKLIGNMYHEDNDSIDWLDVEYALQLPKSDILLIFDCCHAGLLSEPHERSRPEVCFQILAACERHKTTRSAGPESFTTALIWALKQLKNERSFSTNRLKSVIRSYEHFPKNQIPQLSFRVDDSRPECVWLARMAQDEDHLPSPIDDIRQQEYLDIRLHFSGNLTYNKVMETCDALKTLRAKQPGFARNITLIGKNRATRQVENAAKLFATMYKRRREQKEALAASSLTKPQQTAIDALTDVPQSAHRPTVQAHAHTASTTSTLVTPEDEETPLISSKKPSRRSYGGNRIVVVLRMLAEALSDIIKSTWRKLTFRKERNYHSNSLLPA